jgi:hypothetical protein
MRGRTSADTSARQLHSLVAVVGDPEDGQVVLGVQHHSEALGEDPMVVRQTALSTATSE